MKKILSAILSIIMLVSLAATAFAVPYSTEVLPYENSAFFTSGEYTLHYRTYEPDLEAKNQIMLFHGFAVSTASLEGIAEEYCKNGYKVVTVDMPDFGYSSRESKVKVLRDREDIIFELMTELGGSWIVGGHSMGGGIAINVACDHPEKVTGLVLFAPQVNNEMGFLMNVIMRSLPVKLMYELVIAVALHFPAIVYPMLTTSFSDSEYAKNYEVNRITEPLKIDGTGSGVAIMASHARTVDFEKFSSLNIPVVIITASDDRIAMQNVLDKIIASAPAGAVHCNMEKGGHMMMEYSPALVAEETLPVIEKCAK